MKCTFNKLMKSISRIFINGPWKIWVNPNDLCSGMDTVWCTISSFGIHGPYFFDDVSINVECCISMVQIISVPRINSLWGHTAHCLHKCDHPLADLFPQHVNSRFSGISWPLCSPDLSPYFFFRYLKSKVYDNTAFKLYDLAAQICEECEKILVMLQWEMRNCTLQ
jgi:hypothetical protein